MAGQPDGQCLKHAPHLEHNATHPPDPRGQLRTKCITHLPHLRHPRLDELVAVATERLGGLDIIINNAGGSFPRPLLETSVASFERAATPAINTLAGATAVGIDSATLNATLVADGGLPTAVWFCSATRRAISSRRRRSSSASR